MKYFEKNNHGERLHHRDIEYPLANVKMDAIRSLSGENHFDVVLCNHVLEHVKTYQSHE